MAAELKRPQTTEPGSPTSTGGHALSCAPPCVQPRDASYPRTRPDSGGLVVAQALRQLSVSCHNLPVAVGV